MSCGQPHETPCGEVLRAISLLVDQEETEISITEIEQHLTECGPCCEQREELRVLKALVSRACCGPSVSQEMRLRISATIVEIQAQSPEGNH